MFTLRDISRTEDGPYCQKPEWDQVAGTGHM